MKMIRSEQIYNWKKWFFFDFSSSDFHWTCGQLFPSSSLFLHLVLATTIRIQHYWCFGLWCCHMTPGPSSEPVTETVFQGGLCIWMCMCHSADVMWPSLFWGWSASKKCPSIILSAQSIPAKQGCITPFHSGREEPRFPREWPPLPHPLFIKN